MSSSGPNLENMDLDAEENLADEILSMSTQDIQARTRLMDNEVIILAVFHYIKKGMPLSIMHILLGSHHEV